MRAAVVGAGMAGLTAAWWLAEGGWDVVVLERHPGTVDAGFAIDFIGPGFEVARRMELVPRLRDARIVVDAVQYVDRRGAPRGRIDYAAAVGALDGRLLSIARGDLAVALREAVRDRAGVRLGARLRATAGGGAAGRGAGRRARPAGCLRGRRWARPWSVLRAARASLLRRARVAE